jgi:hypothetical protein
MSLAPRRGDTLCYGLVSVQGHTDVWTGDCSEWHCSFNPPRSVTAQLCTLASKKFVIGIICPCHRLRHATTSTCKAEFIRAIHYSVTERHQTRPFAPTFRVCNFPSSTNSVSRLPAVGGEQSSFSAISFLVNGRQGSSKSRKIARTSSVVTFRSGPGRPIPPTSAGRPIRVLLDNLITQLLCFVNKIVMIEPRSSPEKTGSKTGRVP